MSKKINGFSDVFASQPAGVLSLCRIKESDLEMDLASTRTKTRQTAVTKKYNKVCARTRFRTARQARQALWSAFAGLDGQAGDALNGTHVGNLVVCCDVCRGYHLSSPSEWLGIEVALAA